MEAYAERGVDRGSVGRTHNLDFSDDGDDGGDGTDDNDGNGADDSHVHDGNSGSGDFEAR